MTDEEIRNLILMKSEGPNLDYKAGFAWTKDNRDKKYELIRDLMALSNTKDGGRVIFGVRDEDLSFVGVPSEVYESADPSNVVQMLHDNAAPKVRCAVFKREIDGKRAVVFDVDKFDETPTVCTKTILSSDGAERNAPGFKEMIANGTLMRRVAEAPEIVGPVLYLASDASSFVTGDDISVSGGMQK